MKTKISPSHKLTPIEGLRGYLALVVLIQHLLDNTGFSNSFGALKSAGGLSVKCFIIISGFVIFFLIDTRREPYPLYITRRGFRIFPVGIVLFLCAVLCWPLAHDNFLKCTDLGWFPPEGIAGQVQNNLSYNQHLGSHVLAHLLMLHGVIPEHLLHGSPVAFLAPEWSLSLEWQFYLAAPLWFFLFATASAWKRLLMYALCLATILFCNHFFSSYNEMNAVLPFHLEFFFCGIISYFLYRWLIRTDTQREAVFPITVIMCVATYKWSGRGTGMIPYMAWAAFFALMLEPVSSVWSRYITPIFTNPVSLWLGKISYSIYLSHWLVLTITQWTLLSCFPHVTQTRHLLLLAPLTLAGTVLTSAILYYSVEAPFIKLGTKLVNRMTTKATPVAAIP
jgi:peptidoglycan/LPS O-acetylase OafA/YrhL